MRGAVATALLVAAAIGWARTELASASSPDIRKGQAIAKRLCARCHDVGNGESSLAAAPPFRTLPQKYPVENLAEALAEGIVTGHPDMPQFKFSPAEIDALLSFIDSLAVQAKPGNAGKR